MKALSLSDMFSLLSPENRVFLMPASGIREEKKLKTLRKNTNSFIISFYGIDNIDEAAKYRNTLVLAEKKLLPPLPSGEYFIDDIIGLTVFTTAGVIVGTVQDIFETRSNDVYVVKSGSREILIPAIRDVINKIDLEKRMILITSMQGLLD